MADDRTDDVELLGAAHAALSARYQQLVLVNRLSLELFSGKPFPEALDAACTVIIALTGARYASIHFTDERGAVFCAQAHGDKALREQPELRDQAVAAALKTRAVAVRGDGPAFAAAPIAADPGPGKDSDGAVALGFPGPAPSDPGRAKLLGEIGMVVRNARLLERDLERRIQLEKMKSEIVSLVSHELRTPLTAIMGFAELLLEDGDQIPLEDRKKHLKIVLEEARRLSRLVTNFLDLSKLEAGAMPIEKKRLDLGALGDRLLALFKDHPRGAPRLELSKDARFVVADEDQLYRALVNLAGNALKYTPPGKAVVVASRRVPKGVELSVRDEGPGIAPDRLPKLFEKFSRGEDAIARETTGTGLGLAITKAIVEAHGGTIAAESAPGKGATFRLTLPD